MQFANILCYSFYYLVQWNNKLKGYNKTKSCNPFWNAEFCEWCRWIYSQQIYPRNIQLSKQKLNKYDKYIYYQTWQILTPNFFHSKHEVHKFIGEYTMCWILRSTKWYYIKKLHTYTHTHTKRHLTKYLQY